MGEQNWTLEIVLCIQNSSVELIFDVGNKWEVVSLYKFKCQRQCVLLNILTNVMHFTRHNSYGIFKTQYGLSHRAVFIAARDILERGNNNCNNDT